MASKPRDIEVTPDQRRRLGQELRRELEVVVKGLESCSLDQVIQKRAEAVFQRLWEAQQAGADVPILPRARISSRPQGAVPKLADVATKAGVLALVGHMAEHMGRERVAGMSEMEFNRQLVAWLAVVLDVPDKRDFVAQLSKVLRVPPGLPGKALPVKPLAEPIAFTNGSATLISTPTLRALAAAAMGDADHLSHDNQGHPYYSFADVDGQVAITFRDAGAAVPDLARSEWVAQQFKVFGLGDLTTLLVILARLAMRSPDDGDWTWIWAGDVLTERGVIKKRARVPGAVNKWHNRGHRSEDIQRVADQIERLATVWVELLRVPLPESGKGRPKVGTLEGRVLQLGFRHKQGDLIDSSLVPVAWQVREGEALSSFRKTGAHFVPIARTVLRYHQNSPKARLGIFFTLNMSVTGGGLICRVRVGDLLQTVNLPFKRRNADRYWKSFQEALAGLQADGVIGAYRFVGLPDRLPSRGWADLVLASLLEVEAPQWVEQLIPGEEQLLLGSG